MINLKTLVLFILIAVLIGVLEYDLIKPAFEIGLTPEDREFILRYKLLGSNPLAKIFEVWAERGAYSTGPIYYIGFIQSLMGFNYRLIEVTGILLRTLAILSVFPLILLLFKNIHLAALTTIIFSISYTTTGALETGVEQSEYLGLFIMNIFLMAYYFLNTKYLLNLKWLLLSSFLLFISVTFSIMRIYPILFLILLIELFLFLLNRKKYKFNYLCIKLFILYLPFLLIIYFLNFSASGHFSLPVILEKVVQGNWHLALTPFQGLGFMVPLGKYFDLFGMIDLNSFSSYLTFLLGGPLVIFGFLSLAAAIVLEKNKLLFFLRIFLLNFGLEILAYWIVQHRLFILPQLRLVYDLPRFYPVLFGLFIFSLMINFFIEWLKGTKKNNLFLILWLGPFVALFFIIMTYFFAAVNLSFGGAQDHYLLIPSMGMSIFISAILLAFVNKLSALKLKLIGLGLVAFILIFIYILNRELTHNYFINANLKGRAAWGQKYLQGQIKDIFKDLDYSKPALVYFDTTDIPEGKGPFYSEGLLTPFPIIMYSKGEMVAEGCIGVIFEDNKMNRLKSLITIIDNTKGIAYETTCVDKSKLINKEIFYVGENIYALKITSTGFVDIKEEVLREFDIQ